MLKNKWICTFFIGAAFLAVPCFAVVDSPLFDAANPAGETDDVWDMAFNAKLADIGDTKAQFVIAQAYEGGKYTAQNTEKSIIFYKRAAVGGYIEAMYKLGNIYAEGKLTVPDIPQAIYWYEMAAKKAYVPAQLKLSELYQKSDRADYERAYYWMGRATQNMFPGVKHLETVCPDLKGLAFLLTPQQYQNVKRELGVL